MSDVIHLLPDSVANQIAAGEVIQRPASVLKELVENCIDAGATSIRILIKDAGKTLIHVIDNGKGMSETDARMSFERHATSKIKDAADLFSLRTMGFRGEALASIASVAQVEMRTRQKNEELGVFIDIAGTRILRQEVIHCEEGTSISVRNLFFNVPARRRFLKSDNVEKSHLFNEFYRIALVNPDVEFIYIDNDEEIFNLPATNIKIRIENIFGKNPRKRFPQQLLNIQSDSNLVSVRGFVGKPEFAQKFPDQYFFVNGRFMKHPYFHKAVMLAYNNLIQQGEGPAYFIYLEVDTETIDINIHPTKTEVKFENEQAIWSILNATVKEALGKFNIAPSIDFDQEGAPEYRPVSQMTNIQPPRTNFNPDYNPFQASGYVRPAMDWEKLYKGFDQKNNQLPASETETTNSSNEKFTDKEFISVENTIEFKSELSATNNFQLKGKYILTSVKSGFMLVDQYRAHVRILYESLLKQLDTGNYMAQQILFPEEIEFEPNLMLFFNQIQEDLKSIGFTFEKAGANSYNITSVPSVIGAVSVLPLLNNMVNEVKEKEFNDALSIGNTLALSLARESAIKSGQLLSIVEMDDIINKLFACSDYNFTPDGKKIFTIITLDEIQNRLS